MKKLTYSLIALTSALLACQNNSSTETATDSTSTDSSIVSKSVQNCYQYIKDKDTANLMTMTSGSVTTGKLDISLWEKDKNTGMIKGEMKGDTLIADYSFNSEGSGSVREVAFLKKGNQFLEGYGDTEEIDGKVKFKNRATLKFGEGIVFTKKDCN